jgi:hypothetical protein
MMSTVTRTLAAIASLIIAIAGLLVLTLGSTSSVADCDWNTPCRVVSGSY